MTGDAEKVYFTEADSVEVVTGCTASAGEDRFGEIMEVVIRHLHTAVKEIEPTQEEWFQAIQFPTKTGHMSDDWRQEFILLSDVLGVSMLVDAINNRKPSGATETTVLGPFHVGNAPVMKNGANICLDGKGEPLVVHGKVLGVEGAPIVGADGYDEITTHIFVPDDPYIDSDAVFGVKKGLLADFVKVDDPVRAEHFSVFNPFWEVEFDFVLAPKPN